MLVAKLPIINYLEVAHRKSDAPIALEDKSDLLIDIVANRIKRSNISELAKSIYSLIFDLRVSIFKAYKDIDITYDAVYTELKKQQFMGINTHPLIDVIKKFQSITTPIFQKIFIDENSVLNSLPNNQISYETLNFYFQATSTNNPTIGYFRKMVNESLNADAAMIVYQLYVNRELEINKERIDTEIFPFINESIEQFGTYAILANLWYPTTEQQNNPFYNRMKLNASIKEFENGNYKTYSIDELQNAIPL